MTSIPSHSHISVNIASDLSRYMHLGTPPNTVRPSSPQFSISRVPTSVPVEFPKTNKNTPSVSPNYSETDINRLLHIVEEQEQIGSSVWCRVAAKFNEYETSNCCPIRDTVFVKGKFDRLVNTKKPTFCPS